MMRIFNFGARRMLAFMVCSLLAMNLWAERVSEEDAAQVADNFMNASPAASVRKGAPAKRMALKQSAQAEENLYYLYENADGEGWVIVAADDVVRPILAYSHTGRFRTDNMPSNIKGWLRSYNDQIRHMVRTTPEASEEVKQEWTKYRKGARAPKATVIVSPLIKTGWDQNSPYWNLCPSKSGSKCYTGCVATAMAQVMNYWQWPKKGTSSHTNKYNTSLTVNFGETTYDWSNMTNTYSSSSTTAQKNAVATLMYHCGVAVDMQYNTSSAGGSSAYTIDYNGYFYNNGIMTAETALKTFFGYNSSTIKGYLRDGYTSLGLKKWTKSDWIAMLKEELEAGRPIMYAGVGCDDPDDDESCYGHSFVCDGYDSQDYFHFNFGWSNWCDGYYEIDALNTTDPGSGGGNGEYSLQQDVIIGIQPEKEPVSVTGVTVTPTELTLKIKERSQLTATVLPDDASLKAVTWSSNNTSVATVSNTGVVKGIAAGTATITATTFDGNKTADCAVTVTNEVVASETLVVDYGWAEYQSTSSSWLLVLADNATSVPWIQCSFNSGSANKIAGTYDVASQGIYLWNDPDDEDASVYSTSGQLTITCVEKGTNGCNIYQITANFVASDEMEYTLNTTLEICAQTDASNPEAIELEDNIPVEVIWMANGKEFDSYVITDGKLVLPANEPTACDDKIFVGWCTTAYYESDDAPTFAKTNDPVTAATTYYAVFATPEEGETIPTEVASVTFITASSDGTQDYSTQIASKLVASSTGIASYSGNKLYKGTNGVKMGSGSSTGYITLTLTSTVPVSKVIVDAAKYGSDTGKLKVTAGSTSLGEKSPASNLEYEASSPIETKTIKVETTSKRAYVASISVIAGSGGTSYSAYTTSCGEEPTGIEETEVEQQAMKVIENGQMVIIRGNDKYTMFGQKIQ